MLLTAPLQAACPVGVVELGEQAAAAVVAYEQLEVERFQTLAHELVEGVPCLDQHVSPDAAAQLHLVTALDAWTRRDEEQVHAALRALLALQPTFEPGIVVAPEGGGMAAAFERARVAGPGREQAAQGLLVVVDGRQGAALPLERAALVQWTATSGALQSRYDWEGQLGAELRTSATLGAGVGITPSEPERRSHRSRGLAIAGAATGVLALVGASQANESWTDFHETDSWDDAQRYYTRNRTFAVGSGVAAAGTAGLMIGALVVWEW